MKRLIHTALAAIVAVSCTCPAVSANVLLDEVTMEVQTPDKAGNITFEKYVPAKPADRNTTSEVDYSKVTAQITLKDGSPSSQVDILDTLVAKLDGADEQASYQWQGCTDGVNWAVIPGATTNEYWINYENKNSYIRCVIKVGRLTFKSDAVVIPIREMTAPSSEGGETTQQLPIEQQNSNPDYIFRLEGKGFVMLDDYANTEATFYITTTDAYGDAINSSQSSKEGVPTGKAVSAHGIYTAASDGSSMAQMLTSYGNSYSFFGEKEDKDKSYALPGGIVDYATEKIAYPFHSPYWLRSKHFYSSPQTGGIWMLAWDDFIKYSDRLGYKDNLFDVGGTYYFLRDGSPVQGWHTNCVVTDQGKSTTVSGGKGVVRPAFFLNEEFFKNVKLDSLESTGKGVLEAMRSRYSIEDLSHLYSTGELVSAGFKSKDGNNSNLMVSEKTAELKGATDISVNVSVKNEAETAKKAVTLLRAYDDKGKLVEAEMISVTAEAGAITSVKHNLKALTKYKDAENLSAMLWIVSDIDITD